MKHLRRKIRNILLENSGHFEKIATLICTKDPDSVNQGLELAKSMGYIERFTYHGPTAANYGMKRFGPLFHHVWYLHGISDGLLDAIETEWETVIKGYRFGNEGNHQMYPLRFQTPTWAQDALHFDEKTLKITGHEK